ncbi:hypothetical protein BU24DRAFT_421185 [Aaosphaeria arxii CBS 175.79]|uniref:F-box domain-containing protein n=1 Tax=Aaosphaeria arxii CBS 175.79 TaxID=1450172 RepID=A0A6A5XYW2_9PLEO|nr:uncharacterized protein BU24DRAFT_421185 [Aaosphaeria arxii CBS 175.79]KAF2018176.1 hypothetical protein BU24DRAFT_421185 [Aaosphaeria arxii CBS 175.79]
MVNSKNVSFKVDKQAPIQGPPPLPYATVINCRKPRGKRSLKGGEEVRSQQVPVPAVLLKVSGGERERKRKRVADVQAVEVVRRPDQESSHGQSSHGSRDQSSPSRSVFPWSFPTQRPQLSKPTKFRRGRTLSKRIDLDSWFTILSFSDPAQLLEMRTKIASCYRFLRDNPTLWKHSRSYYYGDSLPNPPAELTEFQYAHLRHGHGCMSCGTPSTRKTYWAFLRRWCKPCLQKKTLREHEAVALFKGMHNEEIPHVLRALGSGVIDSWCNFVGVGPAQTHSLKNIYLAADVHKLVADMAQGARENRATWHAELRTFLMQKQRVIEARREFAKKMETWEDNTRASKAFNYQGKKEARKTYFVDKASRLDLDPPTTLREMEQCPAFRRSIAIPKEPNMTSWLALLPKLEKEVAELRSRPPPPPPAPASTPVPSTPVSSIPHRGVSTSLSTPEPTSHEPTSHEPTRHEPTSHP